MGNSLPPNPAIPPQPVPAPLSANQLLLLNTQQPTPPSSALSNSSTDVFLVDPVDQIFLEIPFYQFYYPWIDPRVYSTQMVNTMHRFNYSLNHFEEFSDSAQFIHQLNKHHGNTPIRVIASAALDDQLFATANKSRYVQKIILFCQNISRASQLSQKYPKIVQCAMTSLEVLQFAGDPSSYKQTLLFMLPEDIPIMHKYWLNFHCLLLHQDRQYAKEHFLELAGQLFPTQTHLINEFSTSYSSQSGAKDREKVTTEWMFRDSFYWDLVSQLPKVTNDPKKLAYLRGPFKEMHETIRNSYLLVRNEVLNTLKIVYLVVELSEQEKSKISSCINNYMMFTSFTRGFTSLAAANNFKKSHSPQNLRNVFVFEVMFPRKILLDAHLDHGWMLLNQKMIADKTLKSADIIFNIFNYFKIADVKVSTCSGVLVYGALAEAFRRREDESYRTLLQPREKEGLSILDEVKSISDQIRDQSTALRLSGHFSDSIVHCESKISMISQQMEKSQKTLESQVQMDEILLQKGASFLANSQPMEALSTYQLVQSRRQRMIAQLRIIEIHLSNKDQENARAHFEKIMNEIEKLREWELWQEYFRAKHFRYRLLMMAGNYGSAYSNYKELKSEIQAHYDYKQNVLPFWKQVIDNWNLCAELKLNAPVV